MTRKRTWIAALAAVAGLALVGCAGEDTADDVGGPVTTELDTAELEQSAREARDEVAAALEDVAGAGSADELGERTESAAERIRAAGDEVEAVETRDDLADARDRLAAALHGLADELEQSSDEAASGDWNELASSVTSSDAVGEVNAALDDLRGRGLDVDALESPDSGELERAATDLREELERVLGDLSEARSVDDAATSMEESAERLREGADEVERADAPADAEQAQEDAVTAARRLADELEQAAPSVRDGDLGSALRAVRDLAAVGELRAALDELQRRGIGSEVDTGDLESGAANAQAEVERLFSELRDVRSTADAAVAMERAGQELRTAAADVRDAELGTGQEQAADAQAELADALERLSAELEEAAPRVREGNLVQAIQEAQALEAIDDVARSLEELERHGVDVPQLEGIGGAG